MVLVGDILKVRRKGRGKVYGEEVRRILKKVWYILDCPCGKRLADYIGEIVPVLEERGEKVRWEKKRKAGQSRVVY